MRRFTPILILLCCAAGACKKTQSTAATTAGGRTVQQILSNSFDVSLFNAALNYTGLMDSLNAGAGPYTIFAPNDDAFKAMGIYTTAGIDTMNRDTLTRLLKYHILYGQDIRFEDVDQKPNNPFTNWDSLTLFLSRPYSVYYQNTSTLSTYFTVNGDTVLQNDILATNGVVHTLNKVLKYQWYNTCADYLNADTNYTYFVTALKNFNLYSQLQGPGPITVLAPLNSAFTAAGIDLDSVNRLDTANFIKLLFRPYLLPNLRFYTTNLNDFNTNGAATYYAPDNTYSVSFNTCCGVNGYQALAQGYDPVNNDLIGLSLVTGFSNVPSVVLLVSYDNTTGNGVVDAINNLLAFPSYCQILNQ